VKLPNTWLLSALVISCCSGPLHAQRGADPEQEKELDWFRVELLVFANRDVEAAHSESWSLLPELAYPQRLQRIQQRPYLVSAERKFELVQFDQLLPEPSFDLAWQTTVEQLLLDYQQSQLWRRPSIQMESLFELEVPVAFVHLPSSENEFARQRKRLNVSGGIEVLLHESWLQPMRERDDSIPLQVDSSLLAGDFPELQGSILLYRGRYLHLETNLWLNTDGSYLDTDSSMPTPPLPPVADAAGAMRFFEIAPSPEWLAVPEDPAAIALEEEEAALEEEMTVPGDAAAAPEGEVPVASEGEESTRPEEGLVPWYDLVALQEEPPAAGEESVALGQEPAVPGEESVALGQEPAVPGDAQAEIPGAQPNEAELTEVDADIEPSPAWTDEMLDAWLARPEYSYRHAVLLQQRRRLRSGELHYIDHPLLGLLIKISRYQFEPFVDSDDRLNSTAADRR
jgi:hypothetical protein